MQKILFIAPNYFGFNDVVFDIFKKYSNYDVEMIVSNSPYIYKNFGERFWNFFLKRFTKKNLKIINRNAHISRKIAEAKNCKFVIVNRSDMLSSEHLELINSFSEKTSVIFWDSFSKIPEQFKTISYFDLCYSFDDEDVKNYNLKKINNFYFVNDYDDCDSSDFDVFFLGAYDNRFVDLCKVLTYLKSKNLRVGARLYSYYPKEIPKNLQENILITREVIPFAESYRFNVKTKVILDLVHKNQVGLSFRPFESLGIQKKIITTNKNIKNYDFYNPENIFVIEDIDCLDISDSFFLKPYKDLNKTIYEKYSAKHWVTKIINDLENE